MYTNVKQQPAPCSVLSDINYKTHFNVNLIKVWVVNTFLFTNWHFEYISVFAQ